MKKLILIILLVCSSAEAGRYHYRTRTKRFFSQKQRSKKMGKLNGSRCYLSGGMEHIPDLGADWRDALKPFLRQLGVQVLDPCHKPTDIAIENQPEWKKMRERGAYDQLRRDIKVLRCVDLRMVDVADFIIVNLDNDTHTTGTWEELFLANRQKKPIIVRMKQGKSQCPLWLFGTFPHEMIFGSWDQVKEYLEAVDNNFADRLDRWLLFDWEKT